jgi:hypothetical protein
VSVAATLVIASVTGLLAWAAGAVLGYLVGRGAEVQSRVDAVLQRETRLRHPAGRAK